MASDRGRGVPTGTRSRLSYAEAELPVKRSGSVTCVARPCRVESACIGGWGPMQRRWLDWALLATLLPIWLLCFALHVREVVRTGYALPPVFVTHPWRSSDYPRVGGLRPETYQVDSGLEVGDRVQRVGERDLHGVGHAEFFAIVFDQVGRDLRVPVDFERAGEQRRIELALTPSPLPWFRIPALVAIAVTAVLVLLRSPPGRQGRLFFLAFMSLLILETPFDGSSYAQTLASQAVFTGMGGLTAALMLLWAFRFPGEASGPGHIAAGWAWLAAPFWYAGRLNFELGGPVAPALLPALTLAQEALLLFAFLGGLTWNFRRADLIGRRRVKWVVFGGYLGSLSWLVMVAAGRLLPESRWLGELGLLGALGVATFPACVTIAVLRFQLFDIDRLISMAASYQLVVVILVALTLGIVPHAAQPASAALGIDPASGQMLLSVALAFVVVPAHRRMRGLIDRLFFRDRRQLEQGIAPLIAELSTAQKPQDLIVLAGERLWLLLRPQSCAVYARGAGEFAPIFVKGRSVPPSIPSAAPLIGALMRAPGPWRWTISPEAPERARSIRPTTSDSRCCAFLSSFRFAGETSSSPSFVWLRSAPEMSIPPRTLRSWLRLPTRFRRSFGASSKPTCSRKHARCTKRCVAMSPVLSPSGSRRARSSSRVSRRSPSCSWTFGATPATPKDEVQSRSSHSWTASPMTSAESSGSMAAASSSSSAMGSSRSSEPRTCCPRRSAPPFERDAR